MKEDTTVIPFCQSGSIEDPLTEIAREGARRLLAEALKAEADAFVASFADDQLPDGRRRVVRHGFGPERHIQTGIGTIEVRRPKVRDRASDAPGGGKARFTSNILPKWARRSRSLDALLPVLYLRGISTGVRAFLRTGGSHALTPGGAECAAGAGCAEPVAWRDLPADFRLAGGL